MAKSLSILFATSEVLPFIKIGGISDVSYAYPLAMRDLSHDIRVMAPKYGCMSERRNRIHEINRLKDFPIPIGKKEELATVKSSSINNPRMKVQAYIATNQKYFDSKKGVYDNVKNCKPYDDNDERFIFFSRTVIETCNLLGWYPDIIHVNDWQTALIPAYARLMYSSKFKKTKFVFSIHNIFYQGEFPESTFDKTGFSDVVKDSFIHKKNFNSIKAGLMYSDYITTVSPTYADEIIKDAKYTNGLNSLISQNDYKFKGILNGIDNWGWNPKSDALISKKYLGNFTDYKEQNKLALLRKIKFEYNDEVPLIGMVTRLDEQKGLNLFIEAADKILAENVQLVLLGEGDQSFKDKLNLLQKKYPKKLALKYGFDDDLAHQIEAGSDMYLLPSIHEPCGLNALYSLAYGSVPIVHGTGGLKDIVTDYSSDTKTGNGFVFKAYKANDLIKAVNRALALFKSKEEWDSLAHSSMTRDYGWKNSALKYEEIYKNLLKEQ